MISRKKIIGEIDKAETHFIWCWDAQASMRRGKFDTQLMVDFQMRLCRAFTILDQTYRLVKAEQNSLITNKHRYKPEWFRARMDTMDTYLKALKEALGIGKSIGDWFAWIFYRNEDVLLEAHAHEQRQLLLPPNVGGLGERAFVEKMQGMGGMFVLYHGITSFLRLGDVSFFDPKTSRISTIGELKTRHLGGDEYAITLGFVAEAEDNGLAAQARQAVAELDQSSHDLEPLDEFAQQKLKRQIDQIREVMQTRAAKKESPKIDQRGDFHFNALETAINQSHSASFTLHQGGPGLLLGGWRPRRAASLGRRILRRTKNLGLEPEPLVQGVQKIMNPELPDNCLFIGTIGSHESGFPIMLSGSAPLLWWPLSEKALHDLLFGYVIVTTFFNPAQLWALLRKEGFIVTVGDRSRVTRVHRPVGDKVSEIYNFNSFQHLIEHALMDEHAVVETIMAWLARVEASANGQPIKAGLKTKLRF